MTKVLATAGKVAGVVGAIAFAAGTAGVGSAATAALLKTVGTIAAAAGAVANVGAALTARTPPVLGSSTQTSIGTDQPSPYLIGRTYYGGSRVHITGYGPTLKKVPNPYLLAVDVHSVAGPVDGLEKIQADFADVSFAGDAATGYFSGFLWRSFQLGAMPETSALALHFGGAPGWSPVSLLSGKAAIAYNALFDKDGKVFASGFPQMGAVWRGVLCYDPRKDSTRSGGIGNHRWADPADTAAFDEARLTWEYSRCPGLHALRYALGAWERDSRVSGSRYSKVFGIGIPMDGLLVSHFLNLARVCDANNWTANGVLYEPLGTKWDNLKRILAAGGAEPLFVGGLLGVKVQSPRIALDTITADDLADGEVVVGAMQGWEQRLNTLVPKYRSEAHRWEYVAPTQTVQIGSYLSEDGEEKREERQIDLCTDPTQARQLCAYELMDRRELGEIELPCTPRLRKYGAGDLLIVHLPEAGLFNQRAVVLKRTPNPETMGVQLVLRGETMEKHALALGLTGTAPPTPALRDTADLDDVAAPVEVDRGAYRVTSLDPQYPVTSDADSITIGAATAVYENIQLPLPVGQTDGLEGATSYALFWNLTTSTYEVEAYPATTRMASRDHLFIVWQSTLNADGTAPEGETPPPGYGGGGYTPNVALQ
nr:hypothetical protein [uncultured organism]